MIEPQRVCLVLEGLCLMYCSCPEGEQMQKFFDGVYKYTHIARNGCIQHDDWEKEFLELEKALKEHNYI